MKHLLIMLLALLPAYGFAQNVGEVEVRRVEASFSVGASLFEDRFYGSSASNDGYTFDTELRYNLRRVPMDVGIISSSDMRTLADDDLIWWDDLSLLAVTDYNFRRGRRISYFVGAGAGVTIYNEDVTKLCLMPRVGVEFFNRLRLTTAYKVGPEAKNNLNITLGIVVGGGCKK